VKGKAVKGEERRDEGSRAAERRAGVEGGGGRRGEVPRNEG
jgi:hypothetical protein